LAHEVAELARTGTPGHVAISLYAVRPAR